MDHRKHGLLMLLGCGLMMVAVFFFLGRGVAAGGSAAGNSWAWLLFLLCPLMHLFMMHGNNHGNNAECHRKEPKAIVKDSQPRTGEARNE